MKNSVTRTTPEGEALVTAYLHARANAAGIPLAGTFELTSRCNFSCRMCYVHENVDASRELTAEEWIYLGRQAKDAGMLYLLLTGGEPFLRRDFPRIYSELRRMGLILSINTNASLLNDEVMEVLKKDPPSRINVSLYGGSPETYRRLCQADGYEKVTANILRMKQAGFQVKLNLAVTPYNADDVPLIYQFAREHNLPVQSTTYMYPPVRINGGCFGDAPARFDAEEAARQMLICREQVLTPEQLAASAVSPAEESCGSEVGSPMACRAGRTTFWITWDGKMMPCGTFPTEAKHDVRTLGFAGSWQLVRRFTSEIRMSPECSGCSLRRSCPACAASCLAETGSASIKPDYLCRYTRHLKKLTAEKYGTKGDSHEAES